MQGKLIVLEGIDSSGKKTQQELLIKKLLQEGYLVEGVDFPQYYSSFFGRLISRYLRGEFGELDAVSPYLTSLLYAGDRFEAKKRLQKYIDDGKIVLANRYTASNMAFMGAKLQGNDRKKFFSWLRELEYAVYSIPVPTLIIYLDVPLKITQELIKGKGERRYLKGKKKDIHEANPAYLHRVEKIYLNLAEEEEWVIVPCAEESKILAKEDIAERIWSSLKKAIDLDK